MNIFSEQFGRLNDLIIEKFFEGKTSRRICWNDNLKTNIKKSRSMNGFRQIQNGKHCQGLLTMIFDVHNQIPFGHTSRLITGKWVAFIHR